MEAIPRDYGERCQFDRYCKLVLYHEALDYLREMQRRRDRETSFDALPQAEMDKLCTEDHYPSDSYILDMTDQEIADLMGMSRSAVQRRRAKTLKELRTKLLAIMPEGG